MSKARQSTRQRYRKPRMEYSEGSRVRAKHGFDSRSIGSRIPGLQKEGGGTGTLGSEQGAVGKNVVGEEGHDTTILICKPVFKNGEQQRHKED